MLAAGGRLLYCTCSVLPEENERWSGDSSLAERNRPSRCGMPPAAAGAGSGDAAYGIQLLPGAQAGTDGFYYACLEKTTAGT